MFFQNVFDTEFRQSMVYSDRQYNITFAVPPNRNRTDLMICWNEGPFNLTGNNVLTINFSLDSGKYYAPITVTLTNSASVTAEAIVTTLNANANFAAWFTALTYNDYKQVAIKSLRPKVAMKSYISNTSAETILRFNKKAHVVELPSYFARYTIENAPNFPEAECQLILLDESDPVDQAIITEANLDYSDMQEDWQLLRGRAESFRFTLYTYDGSNRLSEMLELPAGAQEGDLAKKTLYTYDGAATVPEGVFEIPYVLTDADITAATPP